MNKQTKVKNKHSFKKTYRSTNRPLHKKVFLHPMAIMVMLCVGVLIIGWTYQVIAASYTVSAVVPAPKLNQGAIITFPLNNSAVKTSTIVISGTCALNSYVNLYLNNAYDGTSWCSTNNTFSIKTSLFIGLNSFTAQDYNITNQAGPSSEQVNINYQPSPAATSQPPALNKITPNKAIIPSIITPNNIAPIKPLLISTNYYFKTFNTNQIFNWPIRLMGGAPPYKLKINWGDNTSSTQTTNKHRVTISHKYKVPNYYTINIMALDNLGNIRYLQLAAYIKYPNSKVVPISELSNSNNSTSSLISLFVNNKNLFWYSWPAYLIVLVMLTSFWLGEKQELKSLAKLKQKRSRATKK